MKVAEMIPLLEDWAGNARALDAAFDRLHAAVGFTENPLHDAAWKNFDFTTALLARVIGDNDGWLAWFYYENELGQRKYSAKAARWTKDRPIHNLRQLAQLIRASA